MQETSAPKSQTYWHDSELRRGDQVQALREVRGSVETIEHKNFGSIRSYKPRRIRPGEVFTYLQHGYGPGSDPMFEVDLQDADGVTVSVQVGWLHLRKDDFELVRSE